MKIAILRIFSIPVMIITASCFLMMSCDNNREVATQYSALESKEKNQIKEGQTAFENFQSVSILIAQDQNFDWDKFTQEYQYKNEEETAGNRIVGRWLDWGDYQYRLDVVNGVNALELLTFIRGSEGPMAKDKLLTMSVTDDLQLSTLWIQMETLAVDLESNLDGTNLVLKSELN
jgi:hypothetical protein